MSDTEDLKSAIARMQGRTLASKLRDLLPEIDRRTAEGISQQEIADLLNESGGFEEPVKLKTLRTYLYRYRVAAREGRPRYARRRASQATARSAEPARAAQLAQPPAAGQGPLPGPKGLVTPSVLKRQREEEFDFEALVAEGKSTLKGKG